MRTDRRHLSRVGPSVGCLLALALLIGTSADANYIFVTKWGSQGGGDGQFSDPSGVAVDGAGNVYVADEWNHRIQKFTSSGAFVGKWGSRGSGDGQFNVPFGVAVDVAAYVYVAECNNHRIQRLTSTGTSVGKWGSQGSGDGQFNIPFGVGVDADRHVYVADTWNHRIQEFTSNGTFVTKWGSYGSGDGQFAEPSGIAVDAAGHVYVADRGNARIQKFASDGTFLTKWGSWGSEDRQFRTPYDVAVDGTDDVYVADTYNHRIQKFTSDGTFLTKWGSPGSGDGQFSHPSGVAVDRGGNVYVADWQNDRIQKFAPPPPAPPTLSWSGEAGLQSDGVDPDVGTPGQTLHRFRIRLTDPDNDEPDYVRVIIRKDGVRYLNRKMWPVRGAGPTSLGRVYKFSLREPLPPGTYKYRFRARDDDGFAIGPPTEWQSGPSTLPELLFGTAPGVEDGVRPNTGTADDALFFWKVIYRDNDGDPAKFVRVLLWRDGAFYKLLPMVNGDPEPDPKAGVVYRARRRVPAGTYDFRFEAEDKDGRAVGPASVKMSGLTVTAAAPVAFTGLSAIPTNSGAQISFSLSSAAQVEARILNIAGRPVKTLCRAKGCERGTNTLLWNARGDTGLVVPDGTYLVEVSARAPDGTQARALGQVRIGR